MTALELFQFSLGVALFLVALPAFRRLWRGEGLADLEQMWRNVWPYSQAALQDMLRATFALYLSGWCLLIAYPSILLLPNARGLGRFLCGLGTLTGVIGTVALIAVAISIVLFNRPKTLVFPALRKQEGMLARRR